MTFVVSSCSWSLSWRSHLWYTKCFLEVSLIPSSLKSLKVARGAPCFPNDRKWNIGYVGANVSEAFKNQLYSHSQAIYLVICNSFHLIHKLYLNYCKNKYQQDSFDSFWPIFSSCGWLFPLPFIIELPVLCQLLYQSKCSFVFSSKKIIVSLFNYIKSLFVWTFVSIVFTNNIEKSVCKYNMKQCANLEGKKLLFNHRYTREIPEPAPCLSWHGAQIGGLQIFL